MSAINAARTCRLGLIRKPQMTELDILKRPEYIHVTLNYLPICGTILGAFALAI